MIIGNLHHHDPLKANVILGRLEALFGVVPNGYETGWVLSIPTKGMTLDRECTLAAAAVVPLKRNHDRFCFDPRFLWDQQAERS